MAVGAGTAVGVAVGAIGTAVAVAVAVGGTGVCRARLSTQPVAARTASANTNVNQPVLEKPSRARNRHRTAVIWQLQADCRGAATG